MLCVRVCLAPQVGEYFEPKRMGTLTDVITMYTSETFEIDRKSIEVMWFCALYEENNPEVLIEVVFISDDKLNPTRKEIEDFSIKLLYELRRSVAFPMEMYERKIGIKVLTQPEAFYVKYTVG